MPVVSAHRQPDIQGLKKKSGYRAWKKKKRGYRAWKKKKRGYRA
jgi:hypothetical protein